MIRLTTSEYETLQEYAGAVVYEFLKDEETMYDNDAQSWVMVLNRFSRKADWKTRMTLFLEVFNVKRADELAEVYDKYTFEISELLVENGVAVVATGQTENPFYDNKIKWGWNEEDPLLLVEHNKGLVARYALLETLDKMFTGLLTRTFIPQFGYDD